MDVSQCKVLSVALFLGKVVLVADGSPLLQDCHNLRFLRLQEVGFARLLSLVVWLLLLLIMVPNMALPIQQVQVR